MSRRAVAKLKLLAPCVVVREAQRLGAETLAAEAHARLIDGENALQRHDAARLQVERRLHARLDSGTPFGAVELQLWRGALGRALADVEAQRSRVGDLHQEYLVRREALASADRACQTLVKTETRVRRQVALYAEANVLAEIEDLFTSRSVRS